MIPFGATVGEEMIELRRKKQGWRKTLIDLGTKVGGSLLGLFAAGLAKG